MQSDKLSIIRKALQAINYERCYLFGSQARGTAGSLSDYDLLIVVSTDMTMSEKFLLIEKVREGITPYLIPVDIIVKSTSEIEAQKQFAGSLVRNALKESVLL